MARPISTPWQILARQTRIEPWGCVVWTGCTNPSGYGVAKIGGRAGKTVLVHRLSFELFNGSLEPDMPLDHLCRNTRCIAPLHLEQVTPAINTQRGLAGVATAKKLKAITHCPQGHEYSGDNLYVPPSAPTHRMCRACSNARSAAWNEKVRLSR